MQNKTDIFDLLTYINLHPNKVKFTRAHYANVIQIIIPQDFNFSLDYHQYFPKNMLDSFCLTKQQQQLHQQLLENLWQKNTKTPLNYHEIWLSTAYLTQAKAYFIEISFEALLA